MKVFRYLVVVSFSLLSLGQTRFTEKMIDFHNEWKTRQALLQSYGWMNELYMSMIISSSKDAGVDPLFTAAIIQSESEGKWWATGSPVVIKGVTYRARGLMQVMPFHYNGTADALYAPNLNIAFGTRILAYSLALSRGNLVIGIKNYNSGPGSGYYDMKHINKVLAYYEASKKKRGELIRPPEGILALLNKTWTRTTQRFVSFR